MSDITDEELAEMERGHVRMEAPFNTPGFCRRCSHFWPCPTSRLIAALRTSRAENERLRQDAANLSRMIHGVPVQLPPLSEDEA